MPSLTTSSPASPSARSIRVGRARDPRSQIGPLISAEHRERVERHVALARAEGATVVAGGGRPADLDGGYFVEPTVLTGVGNDAGAVDAAAPFGGFKDSGYGREHGSAALDLYLETKTVWVNTE
jgi:acyl-CoA reductase-like NAD-dependent aldehyde dehydrogenase